MTRKKKDRYKETYIIGVEGDPWVQDPKTGDAFYINNYLLKDFFLGKDDNLLEIMKLRRINAYSSAKSSGNTIVDIKVEAKEGKNRLEVRYIYE